MLLKTKKKKQQRKLKKLIRRSQKEPGCDVIKNPVVTSLVLKAFWINISAFR
ncbi:MAG: hypothetical protein ACI8RD_008083 [Bacillariaceae sp.]|jgi:hypothetical protein